MASKKTLPPLTGNHTLVDYQMLRFMDGGSDKFYELELRQNESGAAAVYVRWGRWAKAFERGGGQFIVHAAGNVRACRSSFDDQERAKMRKGYHAVGASTPATSFCDGTAFVQAARQQPAPRPAPAPVEITEDILNQREAVKAWGARALFQ